MFKMRLILKSVTLRKADHPPWYRWVSSARRTALGERRRRPRGEGFCLVATATLLWASGRPGPWARGLTYLCGRILDSLRLHSHVSQFLERSVKQCPPHLCAHTLTLTLTPAICHRFIYLTTICHQPLITDLRRPVVSEEPCLIVRRFGRSLSPWHLLHSHRHLNFW